jgi:hypothetical protein
MDLSIWAYEKLASTKWGVIGLQWRAVPCNHSPYKPAPALANPTPGESPPPGTTNPSQRPTANLAPSNKWSQQQTDQAYQPYSTWAEAIAAMPGSAH